MCCKGSFLLTASFLGTLFTLAHLPYPRNCLVYWADYLLTLNPFLGMVWIQIWSQFCLVFFILLYHTYEYQGNLNEESLNAFRIAIGRGTTRGKDREALKTVFGVQGSGLQERMIQYEGDVEQERNAQDAVKSHSQSAYSCCCALPSLVELDDDLKKLLLKFDAEAYNEFDHEDLEREPEASDGSDSDEDRLKAAKVHTVAKTLQYKVNLALLLLVSTIILRMMILIATGASWLDVLSYKTFDDMSRKTIVERKWGNYIDSIKDSAIKMMSKVKESAWNFFLGYATNAFLNYLWQWL